MSSRDQIASAVGPILKSRRFRKAALTWRLTAGDTILVINFQKSEWSNSFYLNCGVYFRLLGLEHAPPVARCHLQLRSERLPGAATELSRALSFDEYPGMHDREERLQALITHHALPWLEARCTETAARGAILAEQRAGGMIMASALKHLGILDEYRRRFETHEVGCAREEPDDS